MDSWSKLIFPRNVSKICLKLSKISNIYQEKKRKGNNFNLNSAGSSLANSVFRIFAGASCVLEAASLILTIDCSASIWGMSGPCTMILLPVRFNIRLSDDVIMRPLHFLFSISSNISRFLDRVCLYNMNIPENLTF